jgi:hypothetical protein
VADPTPTALSLRDPRALRAYAHPLRMRLVGLLRVHGQLTATEAGRLLGESSGTCSFHLRQLAKYGVVEEVDVPGRAKPWRATAQLTNWSEDDPDPQVAEAARVLTDAIGERYAEIIREWLGRRDAEPPAWRRAAWFGDLLLHLTPTELERLGAQLQELTAPYVARVSSGQRPRGSRPVAMLTFAVPMERP